LRTTLCEAPERRKGERRADRRRDGRTRVLLLQRKTKRLDRKRLQRWLFTVVLLRVEERVTLGRRTKGEDERRREREERVRKKEEGKYTREKCFETEKVSKKQTFMGKAKETRDMKIEAFS
jgi:hypothetical protein